MEGPNRTSEVEVKGKENFDDIIKNAVDAITSELDSDKIEDIKNNARAQFIALGLHEDDGVRLGMESIRQKIEEAKGRESK